MSSRGINVTGVFMRARLSSASPRFLVCGLIGVLAGCSSQRSGVIEQLPDPVFSASSVPAPAKPVPRPSPPLRAVAQAPAGWMPPAGIKNRWECIVVHHSATKNGGAAQFERYHKNTLGWDGLGYHFVIGNGSDTGDGQIEIGWRWTQQRTGAHCKTSGNYHNEHGIGICLVGNFENTQPTHAQLKSLARLIKFLSSECNIPVGKFFTHGAITGKTKCPGRHFSLARVQEMVRRQPTWVSSGHRR